MFEIDNLRIDSQTYLVVLRGDFWGFGCWKDTQMPCRLSLCASKIMHKDLKINWNPDTWVLGASYPINTNYDRV